MKSLTQNEKEKTWQFAMLIFFNYLKKLTLILFLLSQVTSLQGQQLIVEKPVFPKYNIGFGLGIDYGGFGGRISMLASKRVELFGAVGYNLADVAVNAGINFRFVQESYICPYFGAMYGYNSVILLIDYDDEISGETYYGPSFSLGFEFWSKRKPTFFNIELVVPVRSKGYRDAIEDIKNGYEYELESEPFPIGISVGYHFGF